MNRPGRWYPWFVTVLFCITAITGVVHHEPWRDEIQAWLIAIKADSYIQLYENCRYEGHPMLWHSLLFLISRFSDNILYMQLFSVLITGLGVYLFCVYSPFTKLQKALFSLGFFPLFQYCLLSRSYGLVLLLTIAWMAVYATNPRSVWSWIILFFLANTSATGLVMALCFAGLLLFRFWLETDQLGRKKMIKTHLAGIVIFAIGVLISVWQIYPEEDNVFGAGFSMGRLRIVSSSLYDAYLFISYWPVLDQWSTINIFNVNYIDLFISVSLFICFSLLFSRNVLAVVFYMGATLVMIMFLATSGMYSARFIGHFYLILIAAFWLQRMKVLPMPDFLNKVKDPFAFLSRGVNRAVLTVILLCQLVTGAGLYYRDYRQPFSSCKRVADYIKEHEYGHLPVVGTLDYIVSPVSYWLNAQVYYPEQRSFGTYMIWTKENKYEVGPGALPQALDSVMYHERKAILILSATLMDSYKQFTQMPGDTLYQAEGIQLGLLEKFEGAMVPDENYYVYLATRLKKD